MNEGKRQYTWFNERLDKMARLDMFIASRSMLSLIRDCAIENTFRSNHAIISIKCDSLQQKRGNGLWKFNMSLLKDDEYVETIKSVVTKTVQQYAVPVYEHSHIRDHAEDVEFTINDTLFLDILLVNIRSETVYYSKVKEKVRRKMEIYLNDEIRNIESRLPSISDSEKLKLKEKKEELENIRKKPMA